jgi:hypothetical protein
MMLTPDPLHRLVLRRRRTDHEAGANHVMLALFAAN